MRRIIEFTLFVTLAFGGLGYRQTPVSADQAGDFAALMNGVTTVGLSSGNVPGTVAVLGRKAFPLLIETATLRPLSQQAITTTMRAVRALWPFRTRAGPTRRTHERG